VTVEAMHDRVRLTVPSDERSLGLVDALVHRYGASLDIPREETASLAGTVGELVRFTLLHAYPGDPTGEIQLTLDVVGEAVHVEVHDWGRPLDSAGVGSRALPLELQPIAERTGDLRLLNLGADGKRLTLTQAVSHASDGTAGGHDHDTLSRSGGDGTDVRDELEIREAGRADAEAISQLLYDNYHLTYGHPDFYSPSWVSEQLDGGTLLSSLAVHGEEVIGHHAVMPEQGEASAETGVAVVHPAYRGLGIFNRVFDHTLERAEACKLDAVWGRAVTVHPYSQRSEYSHGYRDTALMLGSVPAKMAMEVAGAAGPGKRTASLLAYRVLRPAAREIAVPDRYAELLRAAYENVGLSVLVGKGRPGSREPITVRDDPSRATGYVTINDWDPRAFAHGLRHLLACHCDVIYADLDLQGGAAPDATVDALREVGFFYSGLVLHGPGSSDYLRLQCLNAENVELERIVCDSDFAQQLLAFVLEDRAQVEA